MVAARAARRHHRTVGVLATVIAAMVVPHDPAPTTPTRIVMSLTVGARRLARRLRPMSAAVLVPVKDFRQAKLRLAGILSPDDRRSLAQSMATRVIDAARDLPTFVVCDDETVAAWADALGAGVLWRPGL